MVVITARCWRKAAPKELCPVVHTSNPSTEEVRGRGSPVPGQPGQWVGTATNKSKPKTRESTSAPKKSVMLAIELLGRNANKM